MNSNRKRIGKYASAGLVASGLLAVSLNCTPVYASTLSDTLPSAGFSIAVSEGTSVKDVKEEVKSIVVTPETEDNGEEGSDDTATPEVTDVEATNKDVVEKTIDFDKEIVEAVIRTPQDVIEKEAREDFSNLVIAQVHDYVNVRDLPDEHEGKIVGKLYNKSVGEFIEEENGWYKIQSGNCTGWVKGEYCVTGEDAVELAKEVGTLHAIVNTTTLKVRQEPGLDTPVLGLVPIEDDLLVVEELDGWVKVDIEEGYGYVSADYVNLHTEFVRAESKEEEEVRLAKEKAERDKANAAARAAAGNNNNNTTVTGGTVRGSYFPSEPVTHVSGDSLGAQVANFALQFVGNPYVYGGTSLTNGADCSGFVLSVYKNFGVSLPHSATADRNMGYAVGSVAEAQPGDLFCYSGHVGLYIGNNQIVHASTSKTGIIVSNATYRQPVCIRRIF